MTQSLFRENKADEEVPTLDERKTEEMVIGLVGPVGSGVTTTAQLLGKILNEEFGYNILHIRVSNDLIVPNATVVGEIVEAKLAGSQRISKLQEVGSKFRKYFSERYLAEKCVEKIAIDRAAAGYKKVNSTLLPMPSRTVHIIDSIKHPAEYELLKDVYGDAFWLVGVFAPQDIRKERLSGEEYDDTQVQGIFKVDEEEGVNYGQKVRDAIEKSDFFVRNDSLNTEKLKTVLRRYLDLMFGIEVRTPTRDEAAMYTAVSAAASSACLSRQVGAAIYSEVGELIGNGSNDVPKKGGGLYTHASGEDDHRCYKYGGHTCHNDDRKKRLFQAVATNLVADGLLDKNADFNLVTKSLKKTDIKNLIEYSRAVHAEMEAIISVARAGQKGIVGATLYCTTFPCHSCARHIVASGITKVVYIEPYPKSLATVLHKDAISTRESEGENHVLFLQYEGVAPKNIIRLFQQHGARKADGKAIERQRKTAMPLYRSPLDGFSTREQIIVHRVGEAEKNLNTKMGDGHEKGK
ncbi:MAG: deoxycytidylate deaminase [Alphaproteobacteria bacterium]|nr:deoxycytidylate deaminase [Alphaproteobacteria bacterium]